MVETTEMTGTIIPKFKRTREMGQLVKCLVTRILNSINDKNAGSDIREWKLRDQRSSSGSH